jgi:L-alanine-DL-glutamate epimerase-like enolase superfamily enzyme
MEILLVRVETDKGVVGWGEAFGFGVWQTTRTAIDTMIAPLAVGRDETDIPALINDLSRKLHIVGRTGPVAYAQSGFDTALWDIAGKVAGKPLVELLGGKTRDQLPCYSSLMRYTDAAIVGKNAAAAAARGFGAIKLHEIDVPQVKAAREAMGPKLKLMVDTNCPWTVEQALKMADGMRPYDLTWLEEPVWPPEDFKGLAEVRRKCGISIAAGENCMSAKNFEQMFEAGAVDIAQPSVTKIGGVSAMMEVTALARKHGVQFTPHSPYFGPGLIATLHIAAAMPEETQIEYSFTDLGAKLMGSAIDTQDGYIAVPTGPGLGMDPDPKVIEEYTVR